KSGRPSSRWASRNDEREQALFQRVFLQLRREVLVADLQDLRGAAAAAGGFLQRLLDLPTLDLEQRPPRRLGQRPRQIDLRPRPSVVVGRRDQRRPSERQIEVARVDGLAFSEDRRALDAVLQLADVPRPAVRAELLL